MVSQKFMDILYRQPHYSKPSTSSSSSTVSSDVQNPLQSMKQENCGDVMIAPSTSNNPSIIDSAVLEPVQIIKEETEDVIKEENEDINIKEEEQDISDDWHSDIPETMNSNMDKQMPPLDETPKDNDKTTFSESCMSLPHLIKDKQVLRPPSKRIRKEKIIFDPSEDSNHTRRNQSKKTREIEDDKSCISDTNEPCSETPKENTVSKWKGQWDEDLTCEYCGKYMHRSDYLRLHLMKHTGETPHKCPHCKKGYRARWRLAQHLRTHTRNLPYHCPYCNYRGNRSDYLTSHINRIHKTLLRNNRKKVTKKKELQMIMKESEVNAIFKGGEEILSSYK